MVTAPREGTTHRQFTLVILVQVNNRYARLLVLHLAEQSIALLKFVAVVALRKTNSLLCSTVCGFLVERRFANEEHGVFLRSCSEQSLFFQTCKLHLELSNLDFLVLYCLLKFLLLLGKFNASFVIRFCGF